MRRLAAITLAFGFSYGCAQTHVSGQYVHHVAIVGDDLVVEKCSIEWSDATNQATSSNCTIERHPLPGGLEVTEPAAAPAPKAR
jgi:hypothetical protein